MLACHTAGTIAPQAREREVNTDLDCQHRIHSTVQLVQLVTHMSPRPQNTQYCTASSTRNSHESTGVDSCELGVDSCELRVELWWSYTLFCGAKARPLDVSITLVYISQTCCERFSHNDIHRSVGVWCYGNCVVGMWLNLFTLLRNRRAWLKSCDRLFEPEPEP